MPRRIRGRFRLTGRGSGERLAPMHPRAAFPSAALASVRRAGDVGNMNHKELALNTRRVLRKSALSAAAVRSRRQPSAGYGQRQSTSAGGRETHCATMSTETVSATAPRREMKIPTIRRAFKIS